VVALQHGLNSLGKDTGCTNGHESNSRSFAKFAPRLAPAERKHQPVRSRPASNSTEAARGSRSSSSVAGNGPGLQNSRSQEVCTNSLTEYAEGRLRVKWDAAPFYHWCAFATKRAVLAIDFRSSLGSKTRAWTPQLRIQGSISMRLLSFRLSSISPFGSCRMICV